MNQSTPYSLGSEIWPGMAKLLEEMGELQQVMGKIMACEDPYTAVYWDGKSLVNDALLDELADVKAALNFFTHVNLSGAQQKYVANRADKKWRKFERWHNDTKDRHERQK